MLWAVLAAQAAGAEAEPGTQATGLGAKKFLTFLGSKNPHQGSLNLERQTYPEGNPAACFPLLGETEQDAARFGPGELAVDYECMNWKKRSDEAEAKGATYAKCRSGLPFYRLLSNGMTEDTCVSFCIARGFDLAGIVRATECRCGATPHNKAVWGDTTLGLEGPLAAPGPVLAVDQNDPRCAIVILQVGLKDGQIQRELIDEGEDDATYRQSILTGTLVTPASEEQVNVPEGDTSDLFVYSPNGAKGIDTFDPNAFHATQAIEDAIAAGEQKVASMVETGEQKVESMAEMMSRAKAHAARTHAAKQAKHRHHKRAAPAPAKRGKPAVKTDEEVLDLLRAKALARAKRLGVAPHPKVALLQKKKEGLEATLEEAEAAAAASWRSFTPWLASEGKALIAEGRALAAAGADGLQKVEQHLRSGVEAAEQAVSSALDNIMDVETLFRTGAFSSDNSTKGKTGIGCADRETETMEPPLCIKSIDDCKSIASCEQLAAVTSEHPRGYCDVEVVAENCPGSCQKCAPAYSERHCGEEGCSTAQLWPRDSKSTDGYVVVWYKFDETAEKGVDEARKQNFLAAAADIEAKTCLRFGDAANDGRFKGMAHMQPAYINVEASDMERCNSDGTGWPGVGKNRGLNLGRCSSPLDAGNVEHALIFALGGAHENQRLDAQEERDGKGPFIKVKWDNVQNDWKRSFDPIESIHRGDAENGFRGFNYDSMTLPAPNAGAVDSSKPTYGTLPLVNGVGVFDAAIGQRKAISAGDALMLNQMYGCANEKVLMRFVNQYYQSTCRDRADTKFDRGTCAGFRHKYALENDSKEACDFVFCPTCTPVDLGNGVDNLGQIGPGDCDLECSMCPAEPPQGEILAGLGQLLGKTANELLPSIEYYRDLTPILENLEELAQSALAVAKLPVKEGEPFNV